MDSIPLPPSSPDEMPSQPKTVTLTPDLRDALGLVDCKPGDSYTIQVQAKDASDGDAQSFDVISSVPDNESDPGDQPVDMGSPSDDSGTPPPENEEGDGGIPSDILGYPRKKKSPRAGLPDTKRMRDLV